MNTIAYDFLSKDPEQNVPALGALARGATVVHCSPGGVILRESGNGLYYASVTDPDILNSAWFSEGEITVLALREGSIDPIADRIGATHIKRCHQVVFLNETPAYKPAEGLSIAPLCVEDADFVCAHYSNVFDRPYIEERLSGGHVCGAFLAGEPAGFIGRHDDGSIGMLEVLPAFRRHGIGTALAGFIINRVVNAGDIPYAHIFVGNAASLAMTSRLCGATLAREAVAWIF
jgi:tRNA (guanine37-N1)-methyltransferase